MNIRGPRDNEESMAALDSGRGKKTETRIYRASTVYQGPRLGGFTSVLHLVPVTEINTATSKCFPGQVEAQSLPMRCPKRHKV